MLRARRVQAGQPVQVDGSPHRWFGPEHTYVVLMAAIDDATNTVVADHFREREDNFGYPRLLADMVQRHGRPVALRHDKHRIFVNPEPETIDDQLMGKTTLTQVGRALDELGIQRASFEPGVQWKSSNDLMIHWSLSIWVRKFLRSWHPLRQRRRTRRTLRRNQLRFMGSQRRTSDQNRWQHGRPDRRRPLTLARSQPGTNHGDKDTNGG